MEEKFLYHIWDAGHLLTPLKTVSGKDLQINYQGQFNTDRGPDFRNVILNLGGNVLRGDVEIHLQSYDWIAHEHHEDPHYNNVILHVVMDAGQHRQTVKENGDAVEILELRDQLSDEIKKILDSPTPKPNLGSSTYCDLLSAVDNDTLSSILHNQGLLRFRNKVRRFNAALLVSDFDQVFYEGMMEALGYEKNKQNMLALAQAITLKDIREWSRSGMTSLELAAILVCGSGLLKKCEKLLDPNLFELLQRTFEEQKYLARAVDINWRLFRIRPASHPVFRLLAIAPLVRKTAGEGFLRYWLENVYDPSIMDNKVFVAFQNIFKNSALPGAESLPKPGLNLIRNIFVNIFLPICNLYWSKHSEDREEQRVLGLYTNHPPLQENHITRFMERYLSPAQIALSNSKALYQQGLIEIFHRHCHYHLCAECVASTMK